MVRQMALEVHSVALSQATEHAFGYTENYSLIKLIKNVFPRL